MNSEVRQGVSGRDKLTREELGQEMLRLMVADGVLLTDDLNPCEGAILSWIRRSGAAALQAQLGGKKAGLSRLESRLRLPGESEIRDASSADGGDAAGAGGGSPGVLPLSALRR